MEEGAGVGLGISLLMLVSIIAGLLMGKHGKPKKQLTNFNKGLILGGLTWVALLVLMAKFGNDGMARLITPFYIALALPLLSLSSQSIIVRARWWRLLALLCSLMIFPAILINPARPLIPIDALIGFLESHHLSHSITARARTVYSVYGNRSDSLSSVREKLPEGAKVIGFAGTGDESEYSFWKQGTSYRPQSLRLNTKQKTVPKPRQ